MSELEPTLTSSNPTATERLRALLDERGAEHFDGCESTLWGYEQTSESTGAYRYSADEISGGFVNVWLYRLTPEQAIAATLGSCNCSNSERTSDSAATGERQRDAVEVVRCRDCRFYTPESMTREERGFGVYENMWEPGGCFNPERCSAT